MIMILIIPIILIALILILILILKKCEHAARAERRSALPGSYLLQRLLGQRLAEGRNVIHMYVYIYIYI